MSVTAIGSIGLDTLIVPTGKFEDVLGGSLSHFVTSCSRFGVPIAMVGVVGEDFPKKHMDYYSSINADIKGIKIQDGKTFRWTGQYVEDQMDEAITLDTQLNVFETFDPVLESDSRNPNILFLGNIHPCLQSRVASKATAKLTVLDTMNLWINTSKDDLLEVLKKIDVLIFNETEARILTGEENLVKAGKKVRELGPDIVIIKRGEHGAMLISSDDVFQVPGFPVSEVVDPTGAGDSFAGGFVGHLAKTDDFSKANLRKAVVYGNIMGSFNVQGIAVDKISNTSWDQVEARYNEFLEMVTF
ncbi:PfkB family carbohydrate kinase [bacterium]|nr:PfkB family carbohydrate kinase [bacterium]